MIYKLLALGVGLLIALIATWRRRQQRTRRRQIKREVRRFWETEHPGELYPECPVCRMPFPASFTGCPLCHNSRVQARAMRRDLDWELETATGYEGLDVRLWNALRKVPKDRKRPPIR